MTDPSEPHEPAWARLLRSVLDGVAFAALVIAGATMVAILVLMNTEIVVRYLFGSSTLVADEYAGYGFAVLVLFGFIYAHRRGALLRVDIVARRLTGKVGRVFLALGALTGAVLSAISAYAGWKTLSLSLLFGSTSAFASQTPLAIPQAILPVGFALLALSFAEEGLRRLLGLKV
ncbi:MAG: TRAP transporter small permease [Devosia sp.]